MRIHLVRDILASEYFASENDITTAAAMFGDTIETVMRIHLDPRSNGAGEIADRFIQKAMQQPSN